MPKSEICHKTHSLVTKAAKMISMNREQYESASGKIARLREQALSRISRLQKKLETLAADEKALDRVWTILGNKPVERVHPNGSNPHRPATFADAVKDSVDRGKLVETIRQIIGQLPMDAEITSELVRNRIESLNPDLLKHIHKSSIPGTLGTLRKNNELELIKPGSGRRHAIYRRIGMTLVRTN